MELASENGWLQQEGNKPDGDYNGSWLQYYRKKKSIQDLAQNKPFLYFGLDQGDEG